ncbi:MAG TPA: hypothetical protein VNQ73_20320 [Ilumatobacter sp.]|nr:hypothetical protein [Ilumatobacter sp.]
MIWAKRLAAVVVAAGLIVAAVLVRSNVIDGDDGGSRSSGREATALICLTELKALCDAVAAAQPGVTVRIQSAAATAAAWNTATEQPDAVWLTVGPFPELVEAERARRRLQPLTITSTTVGASQLVVAVPTGDKVAALAAACGTTLRWACIGDAAGKPWSDLDSPAQGTVRPAFAPLNTAVGQLSVTQAILGYFGDRPIDAGDPGFISWVRRSARAVPATSLSGGTPIATIQVRSSSLDVAVGFDAEIANAQRGQLSVLYAAPMTRVDLVLAAPGGVNTSGRLADAVRTAAATHGWGATATGTVLTADQVAQAAQLWSELT